MRIEITSPHRARHGTVTSAAALLVAAMLQPSGAFAEAVDYVTPIGNCNVKLDEQGNDYSLRLQPGRTRFEMWAHGIAGVTGTDVFQQDDDPGLVKVTIGERRWGITNLGRGCENKDSVEVTVDATDTSTANLLRKLRVKSSDKVYDQPVNVIRLPGFALTWDNANGVADCLIRPPAGSAQFLNNNERLEIRLPPGHTTDQTNCTDDVRLKVAFEPYSVDVEASSPQFRQTHSVTVMQRQPNGTWVGATPALYTVNSTSLSVHDLLPLRANNPILSLRALDIRRLTLETGAGVRITNPNGKTDAVELMIFPSTAATGFSAAAACTPNPVISGNLETCRVSFAAPGVPANTQLVYRWTTASCFAAEAGQVPYTATPNDPNGIQPAINLNAGSTFLDLTFRTVNAGNCGNETPVTHRFEAAFSIADMLSQTPGRYTSATIGMRRPQ